MQLRLKAMRGRIALRKRFAQNQVERCPSARRSRAEVAQRVGNVNAASPPDICAFGIARPIQYLHASGFNADGHIRIRCHAAGQLAGRPRNATARHPSVDRSYGLGGGVGRGRGDGLDLGVGVGLELAFAVAVGVAVRVAVAVAVARA